MVRTIRKIDPNNPKEVEEINKIGVYAFHPSPSEDALQERLAKAHYRSESDQFLLKENDEPVAAATIHPLSQNVRGRIVDIGGVATVGTYPHHRRKGHVSAIMRHLLEYMYQNQQTLTVLHPFRESFYQNFGYVTLPDRQIVSIETTSLRKVLDITDLPGDFSFHRLKDVINEADEFLTKVQLKQPGMIRFTNKKFREIVEKGHWVVFARNNQGEKIGMLNYHITDYGGELQVEAFHYLDAIGKYKLLQFLANHIDHTKTITLPLWRSDPIERWLPDLIATRSFKAGAMARIVDVTALPELKLKVGSGSVRVTIKDEYCSWNANTFQFISRDGKLDVIQVDVKTENILDIRALSAMVYGYYDFDEMEIKGWMTIDDETRSELKHLFSYQPHEVNTYF